MKPEPIVITCPNCGKKVPVAHLNMQQLVGACPSCDTVFNFADLLNPDAEPAPKQKFRKVKQPHYFNVEEQDDGVDISFLVRDENLPKINWVLYSLIMLLPLFFVVSGLIGGRAPLIMIGALLSLPMIYPALAYFTNKATISLKSNQLTYQSLPLPVFNSKKMDTSNVVDVVAIIDPNYKPFVESGWVNEQYFNVYVVLENGIRRKFMGNVPESHALFVVQELRKSLHIEDALDTTRLEETSLGEPIIEEEAETNVVKKASFKNA